jgi:hypothetical protein
MSITIHPNAIDDTKSSDIQVLKSWKKQEPSIFTSDDVINAYLIGKKEGYYYSNKILFEKFSDNMQKITKITGELLALLTETKLIIKDIFLKIVNPIEFELMLVVDKSSFSQSELIFDAYKLFGDYRLKNNTDTFHISISILQDSNEIDFKHIVCDGFGLAYVKNQ